MTDSTRNFLSCKLKRLGLAVAMASWTPLAFAQDVAITKSVSVITDPLGANPSNPVAGDTITYQLQVTNNGSGTEITNIDVTDTIPAGTSFVAGSTTVSNAREVRIFRDNVDAGDDFGASGSDGINGWANDWTKIEEDGTGTDELFTTDNFDVARNVIRVQDDGGDNGGSGNGEAVYRELNLSGCVAATLSFDFSGFDLADGAEEMYFDVDGNGLAVDDFAGDGSTNWTVLGSRTTANAAQSAYETIEFDISSEISAATRIRFRTHLATGGGSYGYFDNIQVTAVCGVLSNFTGGDASNLLDSDNLTAGAYSVTDDVYGLDNGETMTITYDVIAGDGAAAISNTADAEIFRAYDNDGNGSGSSVSLATDTSGNVNTSKGSNLDDAGDAPDTSAGNSTGDYTTLIANGGPWHRVVAGNRLGDTNPDTDAGGFVEGTDNNSDATDDDAGGDEGVAQLLNDTAHPDDQFPPITAATSSYTLTVDYSSTTGTSTVFGWIDFDENGLFEESERASSTGLAGSGSTTLTWNSFPGISEGTTYARFRIVPSSTTDADDVDTAEDDASIGFAANGEVEDHSFTVSALDFGDAPVSYLDASHIVPASPTLYIGATVPDSESGSINDASAAGDDNDGTDDEDAITISGLDMLDEGGTYQLAVNVNGTAGATLFGWIDFNGDGDFDTSEGTSIAATTVGSVNLTWTVPTGAANLVAGNTFLRLRITTDSNINITTPTGIASDGEVEDHPLTIGEFQDFGDAPNTTPDYGDPAHQVRGVPTLFLGPVGDEPDDEATTQDSTSADGDDSDGTDDENAVVSFDGLTAADDGSTYTLDVIYNNSTGDVNAEIFGWIDFNVDGDFDDAGEGAMVAATNSAADSVAQLSWAVPSGANLVAGNSYVRLRITTDSNITTSTPSTLTASDGEIEDYAITIFEEPIDYGDVPIESSGDYDDTNFSGGTDSFDNRASHLIVSGIRLGSVDPDIDLGPFGDAVDANQNATDDDTPNDPAGGVDDEDGIATFGTLSVIDSSYNLTLTVNNSDAAKQANVYAWIDFDNSGSFDEDERATVTGGVSSGGKIPVSTGGLVTLNWSSLPLDIEAATTYVRVRITTDSLDQIANGSSADDASLGAATDGEVEDYQLTISGADYGDAPDSYGDAFHDYAPGQTFYLGSSAPDGESDTQISVNADGDDNDVGGDDEDSATFPQLLSSDSGTYNVSVSFVNTGADANIRGWIDFNGDGDFEDANEASSLLVVTSGTSSPQNLSFTLPGTIEPGISYGRIRITRDSLATTDRTGMKSDGEVEDFTVRIEGVDYGDAPPIYPDASNVTSAVYFLGDIPGDPEPETNNSAASNPADDLGTGDDLADVDDEDGLVMPSLVQNLTSTVEVKVNGSGGFLNAWFDWNDDGAFAAGEQVATNVQDGGAGDGDSITGTITLALVVPGTAATTPSFARFRWSDTSGEGAGTAGSFGEVEDYGFQVVSGISCVAMPVTLNQDAVLGTGSNTAADADGGSYTIKSDEYLITPDLNGQRGQIWGNDAISLHQAFDYEVYVYLGDKDGAGADGIAFVLQTGGTGISGEPGGGLGYGFGTASGVGEITPSLAVEFDTWQNGETGGGGGGFDFDDIANDHTAVVLDGDPTHAGGTTSGGFPVNLFTPTAGGLGDLGDIEDDVYHLARVIWNPETQIIRYYFDSTEIVSANIDLISYFGTDLVFWGYTGSTGGSRNLQTACAQTTFPTAANDFSDAPSTNGDAWHNISAGDLYFGAGVDSDPNAVTNNSDIDDGISIEVLVEGATSYTLATSNITAFNNAGAAATIHAWVDFDANGSFDDDEYASSTINPGASNPVSDLVWNSLPTLSAGTISTRFRITTDTLTDTGGTADTRAQGTASDGEVEDYLITIAAADFGDAPAAYGDASHVVAGSPDLYLGTVQPDTESGTQLGGDAGAGADGDDGSGDDEDSVTVFPAISSQSTGTYSVDVTFTNSGLNGELSGWIDFDGNGIFEADEFATATISTGTGATQQLDFDLDSLGNGVVAGTTYARFRISRDTNILSGAAGTSSADGAASDGEVEDYELEITGVDYGDAPVSFGSPSHGVPATPILYLGAVGDQPDGESATQNTAGAIGDNANGTDDENAIASFNALSDIDDGSTYVVDVTYNNTAANGSAVLYGWIDFNRDGDFDDAGESASVAATNGVADSTAQLSWTVPSGTELVAGVTYARVRLTSDSNVTTSTPATIAAADGEVEDYSFEIGGEDFSDAPVSYGSASHIVYATTGVYIGAVAPDVEATSLDGGDNGIGADGDDADNTDDENITITNLDSLDEGQSFDLDVAVVGAAGASLFGWIDFDGDGDFNDSTEVASIAATSATTVTLNWTVPSGADFSVGNTYARLRITTDATFIATPTSEGRADDGEVEDLFLTITQASDYGDAPASFGDPSHGISGTPLIYMGLVAGNDPDAESDSQHSASADGDDSAGTDDEDGATPATLDSGSGSYSVSVTINNTSVAGDGELYGWIDFDGNGTFDDDEAADAVLLPDNTTTDETFNLNWTSFPSDIKAEDTYLRLRLTTESLVDSGGTEDVRATQTALDGEVEDYFISVTGLDYGDAPETATSYNSLLASDGPRHTIDPNLYLGDVVADPDSDAYREGTDTNGDASDDDDNNDENVAQLLNGVTGFPSLAVTDTSYQLIIDVFNNTGSAANVYAWIDFDGNGVFDEDEIGTVSGGTVGSSGSLQAVTINWAGLGSSVDIVQGISYARFRVTTDTLTFVNDGGAAERADGAASDGEVEDYQFGIAQPDYGDAPSSYGDASHIVISSPTLYLGSVVPDGDTGTQDGGDAGLGADGDDGDSSPNDEDAVTSFPVIDVSSTGNYTVSVDVTNSTAGSVALHGWIDFDRNGVFETDEYATASASNGGLSSVNLVFDLNSLGDSIAAGLSYARFRITTDTLTSSNAQGATPAVDGEVEDYELSIGGFDYGDAPAAYGSASHEFMAAPTLYLGAVGDQPDSEADVQLGGDAGVGADGDDGDGNDDENSVASFDTLTDADDGATYTLDVVYNNTTADISAVIYGWIDFNGNNDFTDAGESASIAATNGTADSVAQLSWTVPSGANLVAGDTYVRLRLTTDSNVTVSTPGTIQATDGEIEDFALTIEQEDFSDAPVSYGDASHLIISSPTLYIGAAVPDADSTTQNSASADGDDADGNDDEDSITVTGLNTLSGGTTYNLDVPIINSTGISNAMLHGWIDFNIDGDFDDAGEGVSVAAAASGTVQLSWTVPSNITQGDTFLRLRLSSDVSVINLTPSTTKAIDGETEDHPVNISIAADYGDAPSSYGDVSHIVFGSPTLFLGATGNEPDAESNTQLGGDAGAGADGDDGDGNDDEAAIASFNTLTTADGSTSYTVDVTYNNSTGDAAAVLYGWIDFNDDGDFLDSGESASVVATNPVADSTAQLSWTVPSGAGLVAGVTYARIRLTTDTNILTSTPNSVQGANGEVEDYEFVIREEDFGDAPSTNYSVASHVIDGTALYIGAVAPDGELSTRYGGDAGVGADGDDIDGTDDEDSAISDLDTLDEGTVYSLDVDVNGVAGADLFGWIDFNGDGDFADANEGASVDAESATTVTLMWTVPTGANFVAGDTHARLRITTDTANITTTTPGGRALDGEVEDFTLTISDVRDYGDAPASYGDPSHTLGPSPEFYIGPSGDQPDADSGTQNSAGADGDDTDAGGDDEDGVASFNALTSADTGTYQVDVEVTHTAGAAGTLVGWIDFDGNGTFEADESSTITAGNVTTSGTINLSFDLDSLVDGVRGGTTYARFRLTRQTITTADFNTAISDGEVEDYSLFIQGADQGDAPAAYDNTAFHVIDGENIRLGSTAPDDDSGFWGDGTDNNLDATDDDTPNDPTGGVDDEDGINTITLDVLSADAATYTASLALRNENVGSTPANVYAWIDFDGNNTFDEDERATLSAGTITPTTPGSDTVLTVPSAALTGSVDLDWSSIQSTGIIGGTTYMRVRITTDTLHTAADTTTEDAASTGAATDGEIEDYQIIIVPSVDYGDAPVTANNHYDDTTGDGLVNGSDDPARHNIVGGILLGSAIDADSLTWGNGSDGNGNASDDDTEGSAPDDDDGVSGSITIPVDQSAQYDLTVSATSPGSAFIIGWIDFDGSGTFDEDERTSTTRGAGTGDVTLSWTSFPGLALGTTYARIRISSTDLASGSGSSSSEDAASTGLATDGEVEDYLVSVTGMDFGDVPVVINGDYDDTNSDGNVTSADNAAEHAIDLNLFLGDTVPDSEAAGQNTNGDATDDETNGTADEGISQLLTSGSAFPTLLPTTTSYSLTVDLTNSTGSSANAYAWIDFDNDEEFDEDERATASVSNGASSATFNWTNIGGSGPDIVNGNTYLRVRLTTNNLDISTESSGVEDDASLGTATDGEVEDYSIAIGNFDYGDAPDLGAGQGTGDYRTLAVDDGASHTISPTIYLGSTAPDLDSNGFEEGTDNSDVGSGGNATDDDSNGGDEGLAQLLTSGSSFPALASGDASYSLEVDMSNTSGGPVNVIAWIDFDQSGTFDEDEVSVNTLLGNIASTTLNWAGIPNDISDGTTYARFRITSNPQTGNSGSGEDERSYGSFSNGEIEDYQITISGTDFGDAPSTYGTFDSGGGPKHGVDAGLYLGDTAPDGEGDAYGDGNDANGDATDDDIEGTADEGEAQLLNIGTHAGDVFPVYNISDGTYSLTVDAFKTISGTATVQAWIDWDIDGDFDEDERAQTTFTSTSGAVTATLNWNIGGVSEPDQVVGNTYMRFRITTDTPAAGGSSDAQDPLSLNAYSNGEVEDYAFTIEGDVNISGNIFEDINYGGGNGRNRTAALADGGSNFGALTNVVELWDFDGSNCTVLSTALTGANPVSTNVLGEYSFTGVDSPATYCVRVVTTPLASTRTSTGAGNTEIAVQTFRSQSTDGNGTVAQIVAEIGGRYPQDVDSAATVFDSTIGDGTATHTWSQVITGASDIDDLDFGYNFNTVVNTNDSGQGSLRQFILNAEELSNTGLAQQTQTAGIDVSIFVIPTTDTGYNATGQGEFTIDVTSELPVISQEPIELNGSTQSGTSCPTPKIEIADNATGADGIQITAGSSVVRGFIINGFESGSGINLNTSGSNELSCNYIGTNAAGGDTGNGGNGTGITISGAASSNTIGGSSTAQNLISANTQNGLSLSSDSNTVSTNIIGLAIDGLTTLGNGDSGILINSANNNIGSISSGDANTIAGNGGAGITIQSGVSNTANAIYINSIFNNGDTGGAASSRTLGIDLSGDGETANDGATDSDTGPNTLINTPVLGSIVMGGAANTMDIPVTLALPDGTYRVEFYANAVCNALNTGIEDSAATSGEGQDFTGSQSIIITSGVADVTSVNLSTLGVVGSEVTAKVIDGSGNTSEFSDCQTIPTGVVPAATITGTIFEDVNYGGGAGRDYTAANSAYGAANVGTQSTVELWASDGNNCTGGSPLQAVTSNPTNGSYSFNTVNDTLFCVRVVNNTVQSNRTGWNSSLVPVQTYRSAATDPTKAVGGQSPRDADSAAGVYDAITGDGSATQSFSIIDVSGGNVTGVDFGFNFSTVVNTNSTGQGSLAQFVANANVLGANTADKSGLAQQGLAAGRETSIFMVSNGAELPGLPSSIPNLLSGNSVAEITLSSTLTVTADDIILDGTTQTTNVGGNAATLGTGGTVGTQSLALNTLNGPEVQLEQGSIDIRGNDIEVRGFAMLPTSSAITINNGALTGHVIEQNVIGASAISFSEPGSGSSADLISIVSATGNGTSGSPGSLGLIQNNLIGFGSGDGIALGSNATGWTITNNELQGFSGDAAILLGAGVNNTNIRGNLVATSTYGIELNNSSGSNAADSIDENTIQANVSGGIIIPATATSDGGNSITQNIVSGNTGPGVIVLTSQTNLISENSIFNNDGLGIDLGNDGVTNGVESGSAANEFLNVPDVTMADASDGTNLDVDGTYTSTQASAPITIELYSSSTCNPNSSGVAEGTDFGEGESFEGSTTVSGGNFNLSVLLSSLGTRRFITAIARDSDGNTSEFSQCETALTSDYGDAPNSYFTSEASGGPSHIRDSQIFIGTGVGGDGGVGVPDIESDAAVSADATGDDSAASDDEDGIDPVTDFAFLTSASDSFNLTVDVYNNSGTTANLVGWIDYDDSGTFDNDEVATVEVTSSTATGRTATLNWSSIPLDVLDGVTFARLRFTTDTSIATGTASTSSPIGPALDGEVEDYQITIAEGRDYGDAPDSYDTLIASGGPSHVRNLQIYIGSVAPDGEFDGVPAATDGDPVGDDNNGIQDDEDGVTLPGLIDSDTSFSVSVDVINTTGNDVTLHGWFDVNRDGNFGTGGTVDATEYTSVTLTGSTGSINDVALTWSGLSQPSVSGSDFSYVRVRLTLTSEGLGSGDWGGNGPDGSADGEVEDYRVTVAELNCDTLYVHQSATSVLAGNFDRMRSYNPAGGANSLTDILTTVGGQNIAGSSLDPVTRRYYYLNRTTGQIYYDDGSGEVDTGANLTGSGNNYNRSGFTPDGTLWFLESGLGDGGPLAAYNISGTGLTNVTPGDATIANDPGNAVDFTTTTGGDIAFDLDGNLYVLTYNGAATEFYVWRIQDLNTNPTAIFLRQNEPGTVPAGTQFAGAAFNTNDSLYLFGTNGDACDWDLNTNVIDCTGIANTQQGGANFGTLDAASCIFPTLRPSLVIEKQVFNVTDVASPGFTPGDTLRYRITVENIGAFFADSTTFIDQIPANTTYVQGTTTLNGSPVSDNGGQMPYETAASINSPSGATGIVESGETATIEFRVLVDSGTNFTQVCNSTGIVEFTDVASASTSSGNTVQQGTDDPTTAASPTFPAVGGVTSDPTCSDKVSGYAISGTVYEDLNVNGLDDGSGAGENGISGVEVVLRNETAGTCQSVSTDVSGNYSFGPLDGGNYTLYEANGVATPTPAACPPTTADPTGFNSSTSQTIAVLVTNANIENQDFGDVQGPNFSPNNSGTILPTSSVFYAHTFAPKSEGSVIFSFSETTSPLNNGWSVTLYEDIGCDGGFDVGDNVISSAINVTLTANVPDDICILNRVTAPADVTAGDEQITTVTATFTYGDGSVGITDDVISVTDTTTTLSSGDGTMVLAKTVENITVASDFFDNGVPGTSNDAAPGDVLRYEITFQNISTSAINTIDIFDIVPSFTVLSDPAGAGGSDLRLDCFTDPQNDFSDTSVTDCQIANPTGSGLIGHPPGYDGDLQWDLSGSLEPGESGSVSFTVEVE